MPMSEMKKGSFPSNKADLFHVIHKVPAGDSPYARAKHFQMIDKDLSKAISLFRVAINLGDRVDSALKDMAVVMKQLNRTDEAIEAIKSFRHLCPRESQESLDNIIIELYKRSGKIEEEIEMLHLKLKHIEEGTAFGGKKNKMARSQGKKFYITIDQERSRILGNLAWAYLQLKKYKTAEELYRKALSLERDLNKQCNLALCLMHMDRIAEAKSMLQAVNDSSKGGKMDVSYAESFKSAFQMLTELELQSVQSHVVTREEKVKEIQISSTSPCNRNSSELANSVNGGREEERVGNEAVIKSFSQLIENENQKRFYCKDDVQMKSAVNAVKPSPKLSIESPVVIDSARATKTSIGGEWEQASDLIVLGSVKMTSTDSRLHGSITGSLKPPQNILICETKKSWADMVEEEEQELISTRTHAAVNEGCYPFQESSFLDSWDSKGLNNENLDPTITRQTPVKRVDSLSLKLESFDIHNRYGKSRSAISARDRTAQRALCFNQKQTASNFTDNNCVAAADQREPPFGI